MALSKEDYVARISAANPVMLVVITYELILDFIAEAASSEGEEAQAHINRAREAVMQLMVALNFEYEMSQDLFDMYLYVNKLLNAATYGDGTLEEAASIIRSLKESFEAIEKSQKDLSPVMENAQPIYAGLTYKDGKLSEFVDEDGRGFKA